MCVTNTCRIILASLMAIGSTQTCTTMQTYTFNINDLREIHHDKWTTVNIFITTQSSFNHQKAETFTNIILTMKTIDGNERRDQKEPGTL